MSEDQYIEVTGTTSVKGTASSSLVPLRVCVFSRPAALW